MKAQGPLSQTEREERVVTLRARLQNLEELKMNIRRLNIALGGLAVADSTKARVNLLRSAQKFVQEHLTDLPPGVKPVIATIANELVSLKEGILAGVVTKEDLMLLSGVDAVKHIDAMKSQVSAHLQRMEASVVVAAPGSMVDPTEQLIIRNQKFKEKIPKFSDSAKSFVVARAPVAFTFQNKGGHSSVGYVDPEAIQALGFKVDNLGGYTVLHNQLMIGINSRAVFDEVTDEDGKKLWVRQTTKDPVTKFHDGKPIRVMKRRQRDYLDVAMDVKKRIEAQTNQPYSFLSETPTGFGGGEWFWVLPTRDVNRLSRAFPGGHAKISKWGFAF